MIFTSDGMSGEELICRRAKQTALDRYHEALGLLIAQAYQSKPFGEELAAFFVARQNYEITLKINADVRAGRLG